MTTVLRTGAGFWEVRTNEVDPKIPEGAMRLATVRFEVIELDSGEVDMKTEFTIAAALGEDHPEIQRLLLSLRDHLVANFGTGK